MKWQDKGHELDRIGNKLLERKEIIFYGITEQRIEIYQRISFLKCKVWYSDDRLKGEMLGDAKVYAFNEVIPRLSQRKSILVITAQDNNDVEVLRKKLILKGFQENEDFFRGEIFRKVYLPIFALYSFGKCYVDFVNHVPNYTCTLKCKNCSASIPYIRPKNPTVSQLKEEIALFFSKVDFCYTYDCTGGETFIVSDILAEVLEFLIENYRERIGEILITSNATVVPTERMLKFLKCHKEIVKVNVSIYKDVPGWVDKFQKFQQIFQKCEIPFYVINANSWIDFGFQDTVLNKSEEEMESYFDACGDFCRFYSKGKEYFCGHGHLANLAFYESETDDDEALDFHDEFLDKKTIIEWHMGFQKKGFLKICRHCNGWGERNQKLIAVAEQLD